MIARRQLDMLAYADGCLEASRRAAFEASMAVNPDIKRQVEEWRSQNQAIRAAFARVGERSAPIRANSSANENAAAAWMPQPVKDLRRAFGVRQPMARLVAPGASQTATPPREETRPRVHQAAIWRSARLALGTLILGAALLATRGDADLNSPRETAGAGLAAYRTYATGLVKPVEYTTSDVREMQHWLASQIARATPVPDLSALGLTLTGGRIIPGVQEPAAFLLYETTAHERVGLVVENLDAPARIDPRLQRLKGLDAAYWTGWGHSFEFIGPLGEQRMAELARLVATN